MTIAILILMTAALCCSHFFSASETAFFSLRKVDLERVRRHEDARSRAVLNLLKRPGDLLVTILLGNMVVNVFYSSLSVILAHNIAHGDVAVAFGTGLAALIILIVMGEVFPKYMSLSDPFKISMLVALPLDVFGRAAHPLVSVARKTAHGLVDSVVKHRRMPWVTSDELDVILKMGEDHGVIDASEEDFLQGVMDLREVKVSEIMTPRVDMAAVDIRVSRPELEEFARENKRSKLPVFDGELDNVIGVIHVKDLIFSSSEDIRGFVRPTEFVPETMKGVELLELLKKEKENLAVVVDEYGGTAGVVSLEDVTEEIVGEIEDKYDQERPSVHEKEDGSFLVRGGLSIREWNEYFGTSLEDEDVDTIGGYIMSELDRTPVVDDCLIREGLKLRVSRIVRRRVTEVEVTKVGHGS